MSSETFSLLIVIRLVLDKRLGGDTTRTADPDCITHGVMLNDKSWSEERGRGGILGALEFVFSRKYFVW